jgi:putative zinc finger/helix-turn-helix YgiT family protein
MPKVTLTECVECGGALVATRTKTRAQPLGRDVRFEETRLACKKCGSTYVGDEHARKNEAAWTRAFGEALRDITGADLRFIREQAKLAQVDIEAAFGLGTNTVARWETEARPLPPYIATIIRLVALHPTSLRELARLVEAGYIPSERREAIAKTFDEPPSLLATPAAKTMARRKRLLENSEKAAFVVKERPSVASRGVYAEAKKRGVREAKR